MHHNDCWVTDLDLSVMRHWPYGRPSSLRHLALRCCSSGRQPFSIGDVDGAGDYGKGSAVPADGSNRTTQAL